MPDFSDVMSRYTGGEAPPAPPPVKPMLGDIMEKYVHPEWADESTPVEQRIGDFVQQHARNGSPWEDVQRQMQVVFPGSNPDPMEVHYQQAQALQQSRDKFGQMDSESVGHFLRTSIVPFGSAIWRQGETNQYNQAMQNYQAGKPTQDDVDTIAVTERLRQIQAQRGFWGKVGTGLAQAPAIAGEMAGADLVLRGLGLGRIPGVGKFLGLAEPAAEGTPAAAAEVAAATAKAGAPSILSAAGLAAAAKAAPAAAASQLAKATVTAPFTPTFYLDKYQQGIDQGQTPAEAATKAGGMAIATNFIFGTMAKVPASIPGDGIGAWITRTAAAGATGTAEKQMLDVVGSAAGAETGYGAMGDLYRGNPKDALASVTRDLFTFMGFSAMHGGVESAGKIKDAYAATLKESAAANETTDQAAAKVQKVVETVKNAPNKDAAEALLKSLPDGPAKELGKAVAAALPEYKQLSETVPAGESPTVNQPSPEHTAPPAEESGTQPKPPESTETATEPPPAKTPGKGHLTPEEQREAFGGVMGEVEPPKDYVYHIADYKNPGNSVSTALALLGREGNAQDGWYWDGDKAGDSAAANLAPKGVAFEHERDQYLNPDAKEREPGTLEKRGANESYGRGQHPLPFDPSLKTVIYGGHETDGEFGFLKDRVDAVNAKRADAGLMKLYGHAGALEPVGLEALGRKKPPDRRSASRPPQELWDQIKGEHPDWSHEQVGREAVKRLSTDGLTGFERGDVGTARLDATQQAIDHVGETGEPAVHAEMDLANLGGLNATAGHQGANTHYRAFADILKEELGKVGGNLRLFRHGGDEMSATVIGADQPAVEKALKAAQDRIQDYAKENGLDTIPHPKNQPGSPRAPGTGIHVGTTDIRSGDKPEEVWSRADTALEQRKVASDVNSATAPTSGPVPPAKPAGATPSSAPAEEEPAGATEPVAPGSSRDVLAEVQRKLDSGMTLDEGEARQAIDQAGLTPLELHVLEQRHLNSRSFQDITTDPQAAGPDGKPYSRQRLKQIEQAALAKLGSGKSVKQLIHDAARIDNALALLEKGKQLSPGELKGLDREELGQRKEGRQRALGPFRQIDKQMADLADEFAAGVTPQREKELTDEFTRLDQQLKSLHAAAVGEATEPQGGQAPGLIGAPSVRPADTGALPQQTPGPATAPTGTATAGTLGGTAVGGGAQTDRPGTAAGTSLAPADAVRGQANGNKLTDHWKAEAESNGIDFSLMKSMAKDMRDEHKSSIGEHNQMLAESRSMLPDKGHLLHLERYEDSDDVKGLDEVADHWERRMPTHPFADLETLFDALNKGNLKPMSAEESMAHAFDLLHAQKAAPEESKDVIETAKAEGLEKSEAEALLAEANRQAEASASGKLPPGQAPQSGVGGPQPAADLGTESFDFGADAGATDQPTSGQPGGTRQPGDVTGMGAAAPGGPSPPPPAGTPQAASPVPVPPPQAPKPAGQWFQAAKDWLKSFAQQSFPALTRQSPAAGEKLAEASNGRAASKSAWDYFSRILKIGNTAIGDLKPDSPGDRAAGAVWLERRMRHERQQLDDQATEANAAATTLHRRALAEPDPKEKDRLFDEADRERQRAFDASTARDEVATLVGSPGSPLATEQDFEDGLRGMWSFFEGVKQEWTPEVDKNYRGLKGLDPGDEINAPSQIPGLPLNAIPLDPKQPGAVVASHAPGSKGMQGLKINRPQFMKRADLNAPAYDLSLTRMMQRTLDLGIPAARRAEFVRQAIQDSVLAAVTGKDAPPEGFKYLALDATRGLPGLDPQARYYADPTVYRDVVQGLGIGERPGQNIASGIRPAMDLLYNVSLMSPVELATHLANHVTALFRSGMGIPIYNLKDTIGNAWKVWQKDPAILKDVADLAAMSASFSHEAKGGLAKSLVELGQFIPGLDPAKVAAAGETVGKFDPTTYLNRFTTGLIDVLQKAVRVQLGDAYDKMVAAGKFQDSETGKRDFINQAVGNYNSQAGNRLAQFLKDSGLQSFATAAHTFTIQGVKSVYGGAINAPTTSWKAEMQVRSLAVLKMLPFLAMGPVLNSLAWGQAFPANVPAFSLKTREDDDKTHYFDPLAFTGLRRGARITGLSAIGEGLRKGQTGGQMADQALLRDIPHGIEHLLTGPPAQTAHTLLTGEDAMGHQVAKKVSTAATPQGQRAAVQKGLPPAGSSQFLQNATAAGLGVNPVVKTLTGADKPKSPRTWIDNLMQSAGPFGERTGTTPNKKKLIGAR